MRIQHFRTGPGLWRCTWMLLLAAPGLAQLVNFSAPKTFGGYGSNSTVVADFNGDGIPDIAAVGERSFEILLGNGDGSFRLLPQVSWGSLSFPSFMAAGDFNGDGRQDLVMTGGGEPFVYALLGNGDGTFQAPRATLYS